jgi:inosine-uridine nucleoside N-ribohydrolase
MSLPTFSRSLVTVCLVILAFGTAFASRTKLPVILDTDIGDDIDDTWALGLLLKSPELDVKLVVGEYGKIEYRAKLIAKFLQTTGRSDIPVGLGIASGPEGVGPEAEWVKDYNLKSYPGIVHQDGVQKMIDLIMHSRTPITLIAIGPNPNIAEALRREPRIAGRVKLVGMQGSVYKGYEGSKTPCVEYNVGFDTPSCMSMFAAPWKEATITPLDTCGLITLKGDLYKKVFESNDRIAKAIVECYRVWCGDKPDWSTHSTVLFDTVAIYLAIERKLCKMERLPLIVTSDGFTRIDPKGRKMNVATEWKDLEGYLNWMVNRLVGQ